MNNDEELITIFNDFLDDESLVKYINRFYDLASPRSFFNEEAIDNIEINIKFFRDIPKDRLIDVFICLTEKFHEYDVHNQGKQFTNMINEHLNTYRRKPSVQIKQDIETIENFKKVFSRITSLTDIEKEVPNLNDVLNKILHDLRTKEFNVINKQKYYRPKEMSKTELKNFLENVRKHFNLKGVVREEKEIIDNL